MSDFESSWATRLRSASAVPDLERYAGPFATGAGITIGGTFVGAVLEGLRLTGPDALVVLGAGALAGTVTLWQSIRRTRSEVAPAWSPPPVPASLVCSRCSSSVPAHEWAEIVRRAWHTAASGTRASPVGVSATTESAGDRLWGQWAADEVGRLPVELVGPVPETAWLPPKPGSVVPFPDLEPTMRVVGDRLIPLPPESMASPLPAEVATTVPSAPGPELGPTFESSATFPLATGSDVRIVPGPFLDFEPDLSFDWIVAEAMHPVPPHLRKGPRPERAGAPGRAPRSCASCARTLAASTPARPCPECQKPVCIPCRTQAVVHYGQTWCEGCATNRRWHEQIPSGRWAPEELPGVGFPSDPPVGS